MYRSNPNYRSRPSITRKLITLLIIVTIVAVSVFLWRQGEINQLTKQRDQLQAQLDNKIKIATPTPTATPKPTVTPKPAAAPQAAGTSYKSAKGVSLTINTPASGGKVTTPLVVSGQVPGSWSFEASFPVVLKDAGGTTMVEKSAQLQGNWMTDSLVPFTVSLDFQAAPGTKGTVVIKRANASGDASRDDSVEIPVTF